MDPLIEVGSNVYQYMLLRLLTIGILIVILTYLCLNCMNSYCILLILNKVIKKLKTWEQEPHAKSINTVLGII